VGRFCQRLLTAILDAMGRGRSSQQGGVVQGGEKKEGGGESIQRCNSGVNAKWERDTRQR